MKKDLKDKVALLSGATGGIGQVLAKNLAEAGVKLMLLGRNEQKLKKLSEEIEQNYGTVCRYFAGDLLDADYRKESIEKTAEEFGGLDILINNAGVAHSTPFEEITEAEYDMIMDTNAKAPFMLCRDSLKYLKKSSFATIVNIASVTAHKGYPFQSVYSASKHALIGFSKALAKEVYKEGINVHVISPGGVYTDMIGVSRPDLTSDGMIMPQDVADILIFLLEHRGNAVIDEIKLHRAAKEPFI